MRPAGYTMLQTVIALTTLALLLTLLVIPPVQRSYEEAERMQVLAAGTQFRAAVLLVKEAWLVRYQAGAARIPITGAAADLAFEVQTNASGWPVDIWPVTTQAPATEALNSCVRLWQGLLEHAPPLQDADPAGFAVIPLAEGCRYAATDGRFIDYHMPDGRVSLTIR